MSEPLAQQILDLIYRNSGVRRVHREAVTNWILDTQPRGAPLDTISLLEYLRAFQPDLLERLKIDVFIKDDVARVLKTLSRN